MFEPASVIALHQCWSRVTAMPSACGPYVRNKGTPCLLWMGMKWPAT
jgi:hypothetical protein